MEFRRGREPVFREVAPRSLLCGARTRRPGLSHQLYHGPGRGLDPGVDVTITSYAVLRLDIEALAAVDWETCVLDEAQAAMSVDIGCVRLTEKYVEHDPPRPEELVACLSITETMLSLVR